MNKIFNFDDLLKFANLSGDFNPIHINKEYARKNIWGKLAVPGIYQLLWSIDCWSQSHKEVFSLCEVKAVFLKALSINENAIIYTKEYHNTISIDIKNENDILLSSIKFSVENKRYGERIKYTLDDSLFEPNEEPNELDQHEIKNINGCIDLEFNSTYLKYLFPNLLMKMSHYQIAVLLITTRIVGMKCPGMNSIYSELFLQFNKNPNQFDKKIFYQVDKFHKLL